MSNELELGGDGYLHIPDSWCDNPILAALEGKRIRFANETQRKLVFERDGGICHYCKEPVTLQGFQADHKVPFSKGGLTVVSNLLCACRRCNLAKGNVSYEQFVAELSEHGIVWRNDVASKQANWFAYQNKLARGEV